MKKTLWIWIMIASIAGFILGYKVRAFVAQDNCLDGGGVWNSHYWRCE